jgi:hypothetical protein
MASQKQRDELPAKLVALQMEIIGLTYEDAMNTPEFWRVYTMNEQQHAMFRKSAMFLIQKTLRCNRKRAESTFAFFDLQFGLQVI